MIMTGRKKASTFPFRDGQLFPPKEHLPGKELENGFGAGQLSTESFFQGPGNRSAGERSSYPKPFPERRRGEFYKESLYSSPSPTGGSSPYCAYPETIS